MLSALEIDSQTAIAAVVGLVATIGTLWRVHVAALQDRIARLEKDLEQRAAELAAERIDHGRTRETVIATLQAGAELRGRLGALEQEVAHVRDAD